MKNSQEHLHTLVDLILAHVKAHGSIDIGPYEAIWSHEEIAASNPSPQEWPAGRSDWQDAGSFWISLESENIPIEAGDYNTLIPILSKADLLWAVEGGQMLILRFLIASGMGINQGDTNGDTPLFFAVCGQDEEVVQWLLENGADPNVVDRTGRPLLHVAADGGALDVAKLLICAGADPSATDRSCQTAKDVAEGRGHDALAQMLARAIAKRQSYELHEHTMPAKRSADRQDSSPLRRL
ncbi:ankyrin repeat domain-containing protein [Pseudoxanthomonas japonensis]|uniref:ankyrin repeat domain-containing protein n=1 Tax=Pseudoxanthomonas japonensis TaxID=69284 RepID=UPI001BCD09BE|nr:ankyrin repeat domain-containing protein [Pseudoxanthomonas japonensis]